MQTRFIMVRSLFTYVHFFSTFIPKKVLLYPNFKSNFLILHLDYNSNGLFVISLNYSHLKLSLLIIINHALYLEKSLKCKAS